MKKLFLTMGAMASVTAPVVAVVSCGDEVKAAANAIVDEMQFSTLSGQMLYAPNGTFTLTSGKLTDADADTLATAVAGEYTANGSEYTKKGVFGITIQGYSSEDITITNTQKATIKAALLAATFTASTAI